MVKNYFLGIVAFNHPMPFITTQFIAQLTTKILIDLFVAIFMIFALSFIPASFLVFTLEERETNTKQLQFVSGIKPYIYWISNFIWDLINYAVPICICVCIFLIFDVKTYTSKENLPCLVLLMLLYGWAVIPLMYPLNYLFQLPSTAFVVASSLNVFIGVITTMTTTVIDSLAADEPDLAQINKTLKPLFIILFPHYCLGQGFIVMTLLYNTAETNAILGRNRQYDPFLFKNVGQNLLAMSIQGVFYYILNMLIQYKFFIRIKPTKNIRSLNLPKIKNEDNDVLTEKERILKSQKQIEGEKKRDFFNLNCCLKFWNKNQICTEEVVESNKNDNNENKDYIKLVNLTKVYRKFKKMSIKKHTAVNNVSLGINKGECFGLIGVNGAGKTLNYS